MSISSHMGGADSHRIDANLRERHFGFSVQCTHYYHYHVKIYEKGPQKEYMAPPFSYT